MAADQHPQPEDVDPTGVRDLLASLPEPGPMPEDLVRRIEARLAVERASRSHATHPLGRRADAAVDLAAERSRRRPVRTLALLGAVAAGLVVTTLAVPQLLPGLGPQSDTAALYPSPARTAAGDTTEDADGAAQGEAADTAAGGATLFDDGAEQDAAAVTAGAAADGPTGDGVLLGTGELVVLPPVGTVTPEDVGDRLLAALADQGAVGGAVSDVSLTAAEAESCWAELAPTHRYDRYAAARATMDASQVAEEGGGAHAGQDVDVVALLGVPDAGADGGADGGTEGDVDGVAVAWVLPDACTVDPSVEPLLEGLTVDAP